MNTISRKTREIKVAFQRSSPKERVILAGLIGLMMLLVLIMIYFSIKNPAFLLGLLIYYGIRFIYRRMSR